MSMLVQLTARAGGWLLAALLALAGCAPAIHLQLSAPPQTALPVGTPILALPPNTCLPPGYTLLGSIVVADGGTTVNCNLPRMLDVARERARQAGANVLLVNQVVPPSFLTGTCYQLAADLLQAPVAAGAYVRQARGPYDSLRVSPRLPDGSAYAMFYVYRPAQGDDATRPLELCLNDSVVGPLAVGHHYARRLPVPGRIRVVLRGLPTTEQVIELEAGHAYYLRGGFGWMDYPVAHYRARLVLMPPARGRPEY